MSEQARGESRECTWIPVLILPKKKKG